MKFNLKKIKYIKQEDFVQEIELPESPVYYDCGQRRCLALIPQFTTWDENNPTMIWEYKYIWLNNSLSNLSVESGFIRLSEFSKILGSPQHNSKEHSVLEYLLKKPNMTKSDFDFYFNAIFEKLSCIKS